jgi:hypothetical protein
MRSSARVAVTRAPIAAWARMRRPADQGGSLGACVPALRDSGLRAPGDRLAPGAIATRRPEGVHHGQNEADQPDDEDDCSGGLDVDPADVSGHRPLQDRADGDQEDCRPNRHCAGLSRICLPLGSNARRPTLAVRLGGTAREGHGLCGRLARLREHGRRGPGPLLRRVVSLLATTGPAGRISAEPWLGGARVAALPVANLKAWRQSSGQAMRTSSSRFAQHRSGTSGTSPTRSQAPSRGGERNRQAISPMPTSLVSLAIMSAPIHRSQGSVDMPLVEIDLLEGRSEAELDAISDAVHEAMVAVLDVPRRDRFQIITERPRATCASTRTTSTSTVTRGFC